MTPLAWLALAVVAGLAAYLAGWPALGARRSRQARDLNAERYLAWRGRARPPSTSRATRAGLTAAEGRRLIVAAALALVAAGALVAFFATS